MRVSSCLVALVLGLLPAHLAQAQAADAPASPSSPAPAAEGAPKDAAAPAKPNEVEESWVPSLFGDPTPLTRRMPTNRMLTLEASIKYGLVGTGPTRFVNDLRFAITDWLEVRTQMGPVILPESLMARVSMGRYRTMGRIGVEFGFHKFDIGARLFPEEGQSRGLNPGIIPSANGMFALTYDLPIWDRFAVHASARVQQRFQHSIRKALELKFSNPLDQFAGQVAMQGSWDVTSALGMTVGMAYGQAMDNATVGGTVLRLVRGTAPWDDPYLPRLDPNRAYKRRDPFAVVDMRDQCTEGYTRTLFIDFAELGRPGYSTLVDREQSCSLSLTGALTYGRTESFDVDLFGNFRVWPSLGGLFGGGVRWRIAP